MKTSAIRDKLYDYIRIADDKKIKAIYTMLENEIDEEIKWWENKDFVKELDVSYNEWKNGKARGYTIEEANASIDKLRIKHPRK
jgi:hypothetical protein